MESSDQFICFFCGSLSDEYGCPCSTCELCGNEAHYGYDCPSQVPFVYNQDPCFNQNLDNFPQTSPSFPQQYLCCEDCMGPHATFECQPMNQNFYEPNFCYNSNSSGFDQFQPPQYPVIHRPRQEMSTEMLLAKEKLTKAIRTCFKNNNQPPEEKSIAVLLAEKSILTVTQTLEEKQNDTESMQELLLQLSKDLQTLESIDETPPSDAITPDLPITDSLVMEDEHLDTISKMESDEEIESSVKNLNLTPSESKDLSDYVSECDFPFCDNSPDFNKDSETFSNPLFDSYNDSTSSDDETFSDEDVPKENFKIYSNPLFDEEIISTKIDLHHFNAESDLIESLLNKDTVITFPMIDFLLEEFAGELALINPIPPRIAETNFDPKEDIRLIKKLLYDNSSPRPPVELNSEISDAMIESFSSSPILVKDSDSLMEEIDIFLAADDSIPLGIDSDGYDSEEDNLFLEYKPDPGDGSDLVVSFPSRNRNKTFDPGISIEVQSKRSLSLNKFSISFISDPLSPVLETLLLFASEIEDKVFNPGIPVSKEEKSPHLLSHRGFKAFKIIHNFLNESPMMIYGGDIPIWDVPYLHFYPP
ncbi:hypothetical protein Tco_0800232 [Tanacetum coccineum]|uniref:Reverse transcriptase domain-containing protein n=1 Tax=Tanacetum coccineum TaxID=301880 RepID=A0ABQ4ZSL0_9ASTR